MSKILIVDDLATEIQIMKSAVSKLGHHSVEARDGEEALTVARKEKPDLILLDVVMPKADGFNVCRKLKKDEATAGIPIILITTKNQESDQAWGLRQGAAAFLTKPVNPDELVATIQRTLAAA
jgi:twitching motility two-component system response regulator PilH